MKITIDAKKVARELATKHIERVYGELKERRMSDENFTIMNKKLEGSYNYYYSILSESAIIK